MREEPADQAVHARDVEVGDGDDDGVEDDHRRDDGGDERGVAPLLRCREHDDRDREGDPERAPVAEGDGLLREGRQHFS